MQTTEDNITGKKLHVDTLYRDFYFPLVEFSQKMVIRQDIAEDIVQELFVSLLDKPLSFSNEAALRSYLFVSVKNRSIDYLKHLEVEQNYVKNMQTEETLTDEEWESDFDEQLMNMLFAEIDRLPERCRKIFLLYLDGLSNEEIADICQVSIETVKTQKKRAKKKIKEHLETEKKKNYLMLLLFLRIMYPF
ncbi:MAG: RNA polymerase sigma-70 factor [Bacteroides sp.]|nr:RNA polymerase sigma-70 factor [Bacteroides sp.]